MKFLRRVWILAVVGVLGLVMGCGNPLTPVAPLNPMASNVRSASDADSPEAGPIGGPESPLTIPLCAARTIDVGTVGVWLEGDCLRVRYTTVWSLAETHLAVAADPVQFPQTMSGNPKPGQFAYKMSHSPGISTYTYCVPMTGLEEAKTLYFAAHAEVEQWVDGALVNSESAWADGVGFPGPNWATYFAGTFGVAIDLTGYWDMYLSMDGLPEGTPPLGPGLFYIHQEDSNLYCSQGLTGTISGSHVTLGLSFGDEYMDCEGTASEEQITMTFTGGPFGSGSIKMVPTAIPFGHLDMNGTCQDVDIFLDTNNAFAEAGVEDSEFGDRRVFSLMYVDHQMQAGIFFGLLEEPPQLLPYVPYPLAVDALTLRWLVDGGASVEEGQAESASVTCTDYDEDGMAGTFQADFGGGDIVTGSFNVTFAVGYGFEPPEGEEDEEP